MLFTYLLVLLIANVACKCGLTKDNYTHFADLSSKYKERGLEILLFPCNQAFNLLLRLVC